MIVRTENFNLEFTVDLDERNRVTIPKEIMDIVLAKPHDKVTLILKKAHLIQK
jgi:bifunctional DNA-binding transcriptional regulator/antitoxin component of YhaV-PrlF toxin-antitoxin module